MQVQNISFKDNLINQTNQRVSQSPVATKSQQPVINSEKSSKQKAREIISATGLGLTLAVGGYLLVSSIVGRHKLSKNIKIILTEIGEKEKPALKKILQMFSSDQKLALTNVIVENLYLLKKEPDKFMQVVQQKSQEILKIKHNPKNPNSELTSNISDAIYNTLGV